MSQGVCVLGGKSPGGKYLGGICPWGKCLGGTSPGWGKGRFLSCHSHGCKHQHSIKGEPLGF